MGWLTPAEDTGRLEEDMFLFVGFLMVMMTMQQAAIQQVSQATVQAQQRVPVLSQGPDAVAANAGFMWLQVTAAGRPSELRIIAENSTGAFESVLAGLTT